MNKNMNYVQTDVPVIVSDFLSYMENIKGKSKNTVKEYFYDLRMFLKYIKHIKKNNDKNINFTDSIESINIIDINIDIIKTITLSDLYSYMTYLTRERNLNAPSRARKVASIRSFMKYLTDKAKLLDHNPASELESPKILKKLPKYLNIDESIQLLDSIDGENQKRDYAILTLFLNCGLRLSELVDININRISDDTLVVIGKGAKERTIYLNEACLDALKGYMAERPADNVKDKNALFLSKRKQRISNKTVQYIVKKYIKSAGLDPERYSAHKLRHTAATLMYKYGKVDIRALQEILGHESISTTEIYTHVDNSQLRAAVENNPLSKVKLNK
jgi:integrase/recombinase XerD